MAKNAGRDGFQFFTAEINVRAHQRLALLEGIRKGIARNEFHLLYQPQVDMKSGRIFAVEALLRWNHPSLGLISPLQFIPLAEETGLIVPLGDWVLEEACRQNKEWQDAGIAPITVCVNVSARQFQDLNWTSRVLRTLDETGLPAECLELELTESLVMRDVDQAVKIMKGLQSAGVAFAIDDFGTGYSSLSALKTLPVSRLKLDQSFVRNLAEDEDDRTIAAAVISLGQKLNMKVIADCPRIFLGQGRRRAMHQMSGLVEQQDRPGDPLELALDQAHKSVEYHFQGRVHSDHLDDHGLLVAK
ncbi:EAL domain-containing protein [Rhizobium leguminosarum]|uniref:putative bifunctional diguanylate cyclase/phosphodiesterase n=1 Tax=Rhizobium leguminosarum TaxID=384 RepID=UPI0021BC0D8C